MNFDLSQHFAATPQKGIRLLKTLNCLVWCHTSFVRLWSRMNNLIIGSYHSHHISQSYQSLCGTAKDAGLLIKFSNISLGKSFPSITCYPSYILSFQLLNSWEKKRKTNLVKPKSTKWTAILNIGGYLSWKVVFRFANMFPCCLEGKCGFHWNLWIHCKSMDSS